MGLFLNLIRTLLFRRRRRWYWFFLILLQHPNWIFLLIDSWAMDHQECGVDPDVRFELPVKITAAHVRMRSSTDFGVTALVENGGLWRTIADSCRQSQTVADSFR